MPNPEPLSIVTFTTPPCMECGKTSELAVSQDSLTKWKNGMHIQNAFPNMTMDQRELMMTGTHAKCWDKMFGEDDDIFGEAP